MCVCTSLSFPQHIQAPAINTRSGCGCGQAALDGLLVPSCHQHSAVVVFKCLSASNGCEVQDIVACSRGCGALHGCAAVLQNHRLFVCASAGLKHACMPELVPHRQAPPCSLQFLLPRHHHVIH